MAYKSTYELLKVVVNAIDLTFTATDITENTDGTYTLASCNTLWATQGFAVSIGGVNYTIVSVTPNASIIVSGISIPSVKVFELYPPVFYHGTIKATKYELDEKPISNAILSQDRLPMIWLHEPTDEQVNENALMAIALYSSCELYFMVDADFSNWSNDDHYDQAIKPMRNLIDSFMNAVKGSRIINEILIKTSSPKDFARWGVYAGKDGGEKTIFERPMSGCRFDVTLPFIRTDAICC